jgi:hypothetical protein
MDVGSMYHEGWHHFCIIWGVQEVTPEGRVSSCQRVICLKESKLQKESRRN